MLLNDEITSIHKKINDRESNNEDGDEIESIRRRKINNRQWMWKWRYYKRHRKFQLDNMHRIGKYTICEIGEKSA